MAHVLFSLALAFVQVFGLGHLVFVSHTICEHGALLHAHAESQIGHEEAAAHAEDGSKAPAASPPSVGDHHQHCDPFAVRATTPEVLPPVAEATLLEELYAPEPPASPLAHRPIAVLALAPKSSPPSPRSSPGRS